MSFIKHVRAPIGAALTAALLACGGGGSNDAPGTPASPSVTLVASPQTVEGGAFVALTANAADAAGTSLPPSLSCDQGTLQGTMLLTPVVTENTNIICTATASDAAGRSGSAQVTITATATVATLELAEGQENLAPGQIAVLFAGALPLQDDSYEATLGGAPVTLHNAGGGLLWFEVPVDAAEGNSTLQTTLNERPWEFPLELDAAPAIFDPRAVVRAALESADANLASIEDSDGASMNATDLETLQTRRSDIADALLLIDSTDDESLRVVAQKLIANGYAQSDDEVTTHARERAFSLSGCVSALSGAALPLTRLATAVAGAGLGLQAVVVGPDPASRILGVVLAGAGFVYIWKQADEGSTLKNSLGAIRDNCRVEIEFSLLPATAPLAEGSAQGQSAIRVRALTPKAAQLAFDNGEPLYFRPQHLLRVHDDYLGRVNQLFSRISTTISRLAVVPAPMAALLDELVTEETEDLLPSSIGVGSISSGATAVSGSAFAAGELLGLKFSAAQAEVEQVDFSFMLARNDAEPEPFEATLSIDLPEAEDAAVEIIQGIAATSAVTTVGADTLEVVASPVHGSVLIENDGSFVFTPSGQYFGPDQFTYRAHNENGYSRVATVAINIKRKFEGLWTIQMDRTLTSNNPDGLCEDEPDTTETHAISKVSDTLYQATYLGETINLRMSSVDDAGGPSGSLSGSYPDGPDDEGETTETLSINIPDSTHLHGTLNWSYSGPNGSCAGNTVLTGTRAPGSF